MDIYSATSKYYVRTLFPCGCSLFLDTSTHHPSSTSLRQNRALLLFWGLKEAFLLLLLLFFCVSLSACLSAGLPVPVCRLSQPTFYLSLSGAQQPHHSLATSRISQQRPQKSIDNPIADSRASLRAEEERRLGAGGEEEEEKEEERYNFIATNFECIYRH